MLKSSQLLSLLVLATALVLSGCLQDLNLSTTCDPGRDVTLDQGHFCVIEGAIAVETGFICPVDRPYVFEVGDATVCSDTADLPPDLVGDLEIGPIEPPAGGVADSNASPGSPANPSGGEPEPVADHEPEDHDELEEEDEFEDEDEPEEENELEEEDEPEEEDH